MAEGSSSCHEEASGSGSSPSHKCKPTATPRPPTAPATTRLPAVTAHHSQQGLTLNPITCPLGLLRCLAVGAGAPHI